MKLSAFTASWVECSGSVVACSTAKQLAAAAVDLGVLVAETFLDSGAAPIGCEPTPGFLPPLSDLVLARNNKGAAEWGLLCLIHGPSVDDQWQDHRSERSK